MANSRKLALWAIQRLATIARVYPVGQPRAWLCRARAHRLLDQPGRARRACRKALEGSERLQMPYEQALALLESSLDPGQSIAERNSPPRSGSSHSRKDRRCHAEPVRQGPAHRHPFVVGPRSSDPSQSMVRPKQTSAMSSFCGRPAA